MPRLGILSTVLLALTIAADRAGAQACREPDTICLRDLDGRNGVRFDAVDTRGHTGEAVAFAGDLNGDGVDDLVVGEPDADGGVGAVYIVYGRRQPFAGSEPLVGLPDGLGTRLTPGPAGGSGVVGFGSRLARIGDLDGDGLDDLAIGSLDFASGSGQSWVLFGRADGFAAQATLGQAGVRALELRPTGPADLAGAVASAGDFNDDGRPDLAVGAPGAGAGGATYVLFGRDGSARPFPDSLPLGSWPAGDGLTLLGGPGQFAGAALAGAPAGRTADANGDGVDDLLISAPRTSPAGREGAGRVYLVFGSPHHGLGPRSIDLPSMPVSAGVRFDALEERTGMLPAFLGDLNGDGHDDFGFFSAVYGPSGTINGRAWIRFGRALSDGFLPIEPLWVLDASRGVQVSADRADSRAFGSGAAAIGDFDGDGIDDALIGASSTSFNPPRLNEAGRGFILQGAAAWPDHLELGLAPQRYIPIDSVTEHQNLGDGVAGLGDLNGDGANDIVLGGPGPSGPGGPPGAAFVIFGDPPPPCPADLDGDGALTMFDFIEFQNLFDASDPRADLNGDGAFTIFDFLGFQALFDLGCG